MQDLTVILWAMGGGFTIMFALMAFLWHAIRDLDAKVDRNEAKFNARLDTKIEPIIQKINEIDRNINELDKRITNSISELDKRLTSSIYELDKRITNSISELDRRLYGIEAVLRMKECCVLQTEKNIKKVEGE